MSNPILAAHASELDPAYRLFDNLTDPALRAEAAKLIDFLRGQEIAVPLDSPPDSIPFLRAAAAAAHPDRKCLGLLAARFPAWLREVKPESRTAFLEGLAPLAPGLADLGEAGMSDVIAAVNRDPRLMAVVHSYALTTRGILNAIAKLAASDAPVEWLQRLTGAVTLAKMEESKDAERILPALAAIPDALPAIVTLAESNVSSAYGACKGLPAALARVPDRAAYLENVRELAGSVGISSVGFALSTLPDLCKKTGAREFVALAAECAREYGQRAGQAFLERKTAAARGA